MLMRKYISSSSASRASCTEARSYAVEQVLLIEITSHGSNPQPPTAENGDHCLLPPWLNFAPLSAELVNYLPQLAHALVA